MSSYLIIIGAALAIVGIVGLIWLGDRWWRNGGK